MDVLYVCRLFDRIKRIVTDRLFFEIFGNYDKHLYNNEAIFSKKYIDKRMLNLITPFD
jgi:hypothetical protein